MVCPAAKEEIKWRIKSRQLWLKEGDKNTAYFHKQATTRKTRNNVRAINDSEGNHYNNQEDIKREASSHFRSLLTEAQEEVDYSELLQHLPKGITQEINEILNRDIEEEEIRKAIWTLQPDKSPGPDGFPINFYRDYWQLIKKRPCKNAEGNTKEREDGRLYQFYLPCSHPQRKSTHLILQVSANIFVQLFIQDLHENHSHETPAPPPILDI